MSLYTPVFPPLHEFSSLRKDLPETSSTGALGKQQGYVEFLRDVHLFLSTQSDVLSPPSRPSSPSSDRRIQKVKDEIKDALSSTEGETSSGKWTRVSQALKLGCVRGRPWSAPESDDPTPEENTDWILPDEESEWIEWEKKRKENRRLKGKTTGCAVPTTPNAQKPSHAEPSQSNKIRERCPPGVSPTVLRAAKEKVRKWQASVPSDGTTSGSSLGSSRAVVAAAAATDKTEKPLRCGTIDFTVVKPIAKSIIAEKLPSPTKSVKSFFSAPDSDPADSPVKANLLLESPVSPMLSYAQNASGFLPQMTSTQVKKGSPSPDGSRGGVFGMGYSSQLDVERHVDRVSELLGKDVDFDGWLRDVRTVED